MTCNGWARGQAQGGPQPHMSAAVARRFWSAEPGFAWWSHPREARVTRKEGAPRGNHGFTRDRARGGNMVSPTLEIDGRWFGVFPHPRVSAGPDATWQALDQTVTMPTAVELVRDVILRDGSTLRLRPPGSMDADRVLAFFARLSDESVYLRFHGFPSLSPALVAPFLDPDWSDRGSLIGTLGAGGDERVVALASIVRLRGPSSAEVAFAVADDLQGHGIATRLLEQLAEPAADAGIESFVAQVMQGNRAMLRVFEEAGFAVGRRIEGGTIEVTLSLEPTGDYRERVDRRDHLAVTASLEPFFAPRAVV